MKYAMTCAAAVALTAAGACSQYGSERTTGSAAPSGISLGNPADAAVRTYRVTIDNLTTGQPFSPGAVVTHSNKTGLFQVGGAASEGVRQIAENGDPAAATTALSGHPEVFQAVATTAPVHRMGGPGPASLDIDITAAANANFLSVAVMLICTNDAFTGVDSLRLPGGFNPEVYLAGAYDAGTESNTEAATDIVDPCGAIGPVAMAGDGSNDRPATSNPISHHPNIQGGSDLSAAAHGWTGPVARITVRRLR